MPALSPLSARADAAPKATFGQINWAGSEASTADEWLELKNLSDTLIDLTGWSILGGAGVGKPLPLPTNSTIPANGTFLISNYDLGDPKTTLTIKPDVVTTAVSLSNSALDLTLIASDGTEVDHYPTTPEFEAPVAAFSTTPLPPSGVALTTSPTGEPPSEGGGVSEPFLTTPITTPFVPLEGGSEPLLITPEPEPPLVVDLVEKTVPIADPCLICPVRIVTVEAAAPECKASLTIPSTAPAATDSPMFHSYPAHSVVINEFVSDPVDGTEWIEILNTTDGPIDLTGWTEKDATTSKTMLPTQTLEAHSFFVLQNPKSKLNNDGDSIFLFDGTGATIDAISYDKTSAPKKGRSFSRFTDTWAETNPTPLGTNSRVDAWVDPNITYETANDTTTVISNPETNSGSNTGTDNSTGTASPIRVEREPQVATGVVAASTQIEPPLTSPRPSPLRGEGGANQSEPAIPVIDASEITNYAAKTTVTVEGVLVGLPGMFGKQLAYIDGLEIYFNKADWPKLSPMTRIRVTGVVDPKDGYTRLKISKRSNIQIVGDDSIAPDALETLDDATHGLLMSLSGSVVDLTGKSLTIGLDNGELIVANSSKTTAVDFSNLAFDDRVAVTGIVRLVKGAWTVTILDQTGLTILNGSMGTESGPITSPLPPPSKGGGATLPPAGSTHGSTPTSINSPTKPVPWVGGGLLTTSLGALAYWFAKAKGITIPLIS